MSIDVSNNITALYRTKQSARNNSSTEIIHGSAPVDNKVGEDEIATYKKVGIGVCSALGVAGSLMLLAKFDKARKYSINPLKMFKGNIKDSFIAQKKYKAKEIVTIGAGSILGGLAGGRLFGDKKDSEARLREGIVQITNISFPIAFVEALCWCGTKIAAKTMPAWNKSQNVLKQAVTKLPSAAGAMVGLMCGMYIGNRCSNKINEKIFHKKDDRPIKWKDFSAHVDDIGVAATFVAPDNIVTKGISRLIPAALIVAGYETGIKKESVDLR